LVRPKKKLGQHFLNNPEIAHQIVNSVQGFRNYERLLEIGAGTGVLSFLILKREFDALFLDIDSESVGFLRKQLKEEEDRVVHGDFLKLDLDDLMGSDAFGIVGNFPYNISSQIFFKVLEHRDRIPEVVCMLQKEVGDRLASSHGSRAYGILSVLLQTFYSIETLFDVGPENFNPPPKVMSTVIRLTRNERTELPCDFSYFRKVVKQGFQNRRKTLRNALKPINLPVQLLDDPILSLRAEQLTVDQFLDLSTRIEECQKN